MKKTGQLLREAREARGISLQEVSVQLKINSRILRALEEGDRSQLPAKTFLRGFVQSYAQYLRLDGNEVLELFQAEMGTTHPKMITKQVEMAAETTRAPAPQATSSEGIQVSEAKATPAFEVKKEEAVQRPMAPSLSVDQKTWSHSMKIGTAAVILIIGAIIVGVIKTIEKYEREAQVIQPPPLELQAVPRSEVMPLVSPLASMVPEDQSTLSVSGTPVPSPVTETTAAAIAATDLPKPTPQASAMPLPAEVAPTVAPEVEANNNRPQEVIIEALDKVVVEYSIDDKPKATIVLNPEKVHTFRGDKKVSLSFSDGGSINLIYNGKDKGVPGNLGKPLKLNFPE